MRLALVALLVGAGSCSIPEEEWFGKIADPDPDHFTLCNFDEPDSIDPGIGTATNAMTVMYQLFDGLTAWDPQSLPMPSLATSWDISPDWKTFTFHLRKDGRWSDGRPITSDDFVYGIARVLHPLTGSRNAEALWRLVHGKEYTSNTIKLVLRASGPFAAGDVVTVTPAKKDDHDLDANHRTLVADTPLSVDPDPAAATYESLPRGAEVTLVELGGPGCPTRPRDLGACDWGYVYWDGLPDGIYGWVRLDRLAQPHGDDLFEAVATDDPKESARKGTVAGRDLLMLPEVLGVGAPDPHTLVLRTAEPCPFLIDLTAQRAFRPTPRWVVSRWPRRWVRPEHIVTSGEYHLTFWRQRDKFELRRSETFWGRQGVRVERVTILSMNDQSANANSYYQGSCDALTANNIPASYYPVLAGEIDGTRRRDYSRDPMNSSYYYLINNEKFANRHFRRALNHALDRTMLPKILKGGQIPTESLVPGTPFAQMSDEDLALCGATRDEHGMGMIVEAGKICYKVPIGPRFDLAKAKEELALAARELGAAMPKRVTITFNAGVEYHKTIAEWIQAEWKKHLGLDSDLQAQEWGVFLNDTAHQKYDIARMGNRGNFPDPEAEYLSSLFRCGAPDNKPGYCSAEFDALLDEAARQSDRKKRVELARRAEQVMLDDAAIIPLYVYTQHNLIKPYVRGIQVNLHDQHQLRHLWIDPAWRQTGGRYGQAGVAR
jgi:oligopeptide transport system substrate-binding protein